MKYLYLLISLLLISVSAFAQHPKSFSQTVDIHTGTHDSQFGSLENREDFCSSYYEAEQGPQAAFLQKFRKSSNLNVVQSTRTKHQ